MEPAAFFYLTPELRLAGRQDKRAPPTLTRLVDTSPRTPKRMHKSFRSACSGAVTRERVQPVETAVCRQLGGHRASARRLLSILILGRKTRVQFSAPINLRELIEHNKGHERTVRMAQRILRVHFRNLKTAVIGPDLSHRRNLVKGLGEYAAGAPSHRRRSRARKDQPRKGQGPGVALWQRDCLDYTYTAIRFLEVVLSWFWNKIYDGIKVNNIEGVQKVARGHEVIYVLHATAAISTTCCCPTCCSRTAPDPAAHRRRDQPEHAGDRQPAAPWRCVFHAPYLQGNPLYTSVFNEYLHTLFTKGFPGGVLRRRRALAHRAHAATENRHAGNHPA